ncbi:MAG: cytochrome c nitrite reductase small subunit [Anaerolineae bacterium]|jgi:cytochrome c nitrite reductase small subunit|nr:cytochrome c nitrite reductase small subunit [Anaerolineae bacterium]
MRRLNRPTFLFIVAGMVCVIVGLGLFTFVYARGDSYLSDDPNTCNNCHVMREQFQAWQHSSHSRFATCNDCHTPHDSPINKWLVKGINGFNHSFAFTFTTYPEVIRINQMNRDVTQANCLYCHDMAVSEIAPIHSDAPDCLTCHTGIGHRTRK